MTAQKISLLNVTRAPKSGTSTFSNFHLVAGISIGMVALVVSMSCAYMIHQKRSLAAVKQRYFKQHGGLLLFEEMKSKQGLSFTLFTKEELEEATNKFDERNVLGKGGNVKAIGYSRLRGEG